MLLQDILPARDRTEVSGQVGPGEEPRLPTQTANLEAVESHRLTELQRSVSS